MTEIMISIKPEWVEKIFQLRKTWELRKTMPKGACPFTCYIYQTGNGGVVGSFICDCIDEIRPKDINEITLKDTCVMIDDALYYASGKLLYKWRIRSIVEYMSPRPLSAYGLERPPQSWCYVNTQWKKVEGVRVENGQIIIEPKGGDPDG